MSGLALLSAYGSLPPDRTAGTRRATLRPRGVSAAETPQTGRVLAAIRSAAGRGRPPPGRAPLPAAAGRLCSPVHVTRPAEAAHLSCTPDAPLTHGRAAAAPHGPGRPALGRSLDPRVAQSPGRSGPNHPHLGLVHVSAGLQPAMDGAGASDPADLSPLAPGADHGPDAAGRVWQGAPRGSGGADRGQDRRGAAVCGGGDQDSAGIWPPPGAGRPL